MTVPINLLSWLLSVLPLVLLVILLIGKKWPAYRAAPLAFGISGIIALTYFRCGVPLVAVECAKGAWNAMAILLVIFSAVLLYEISNSAGAFDTMKQGLQSLTPHELLLLLLLGYVFPSFLQGITGFGVAVAVGAPLLVGIGVKPLWAVISVLLAHSWGGTFGTLALAWSALLEQAGAGETMRAATALVACGLLWIVNFVGGFCVCWFYGKGRGVKEGLPALICISLVHGGGQLLIAQVNDTLACFVPAALAFVVVLLLCKTKRYRRPWMLADSPMMRREKSGERHAKAMGFHRAFSPYYFLTGSTLICLLVPAVNQVLASVRISLSFPGGETGFGYQTPAVENFSPYSPFTHPSFYLLLSCVFACAVFWGTGNFCLKDIGTALGRAVKKTVPSGMSVLCFIWMSKIMSCSGQIEILAQSFVRIFGGAYPLLTPLIGLLGSFITSSNMSSNILFGKFQLTTAALLNQNAAIFLGAQTAGGAIGNAICPGNVILGCTTAGLPGSEGDVLKRVIPVTAVTALLCGIITLVITVL